MFSSFLDEKRRLLSQVVRPQESRSLSPTHLSEDKQSRWKESERKQERKDSSRHYEETDFKERTSSGDKQREQREQREPREPNESSRSRVPEVVVRPSEEREAVDHLHEDKKKSKVQKKTMKKKKEDDVAVDRYVSEPAVEKSQVFSPKKGQKKKNAEKKRKRSKGDSEASEEDSGPHQKKKKGPRTPPVTTKEELVEVVPEKPAVVVEAAPKREDTTFSDWSDEDVPERGETILERAAEEPQRNSHRARAEAVETSHVAEEPPHVKPAEQKRSSSLSSNRSRTSSRLRSPSNDSAHRSGDDQTGLKKILHSSSSDRERERRCLEIAGERKSRIDQLKRGVPSRSTSSGIADGAEVFNSFKSVERDRFNRRCWFLVDNFFFWSLVISRSAYQAEHGKLLTVAVS